MREGVKMQVIAVVGTKKSGKTTTIESLIRELAGRGYKVGAIKHVPEADHTIDIPGKDTWRYAQAGAKIIVSAAANEIATIEKASLEAVTISALVKKCKGSDIVFIEGLKRKVAKQRKIPKIVLAKNLEETVKALENYEPILAFSGPYSPESLRSEIPYADALSKPQDLADIIEKKLLNK